MSKIDVSFKVDGRTIKSFVNKVDAIVRSTRTGTKEELEAFCIQVLSRSNDRIPVDTGTAAESAGYEVKASGALFEARLGYGIIRDPVNPRNGMSASSYVAIIHETYSGNNGQAKFFESALYESAGQLNTAMQKVVNEALQGNVDTLQESRAQIDFAYLSRLNAGYTARVLGGKLREYSA